MTDTERHLGQGSEAFGRAHAAHVQGSIAVVCDEAGACL